MGVPQQRLRTEVLILARTLETDPLDSSKTGVSRLQGTLKVENQEPLGLQELELRMGLSLFSGSHRLASPWQYLHLFLGFSPDFLGFPAQSGCILTLYQGSPAMTMPLCVS